MTAHNDAPITIGVVIPHDDSHAAELLGDAADLAKRLNARVDACTAQDEAAHHQTLIAQGADDVTVIVDGNRGINHRLAGTVAWYQRLRPRVVFAAATGDDRTLAARLSVRCTATLISPALSVAVRRETIEITGLSADGRRARITTLRNGQSAVVTLRPAVGQARAPQSNRQGAVRRLTIEPQDEPVQLIERIPADPATTDIVHLPRLVAGGRGLGGAAGFRFLLTVAARLNAGVAASRMAVDLGWIDRDRQVGQTGKTVHPELYIACGISGATHHCEGMSDSRHIIAINVDRAAPIFQIAHLGLVADWQQTLQHLLDMTEPPLEKATQVS